MAARNGVRCRSDDSCKRGEAGGAQGRVRGVLRAQRKDASGDVIAIDALHSERRNCRGPHRKRRPYLRVLSVLFLISSTFAGDVSVTSRGARCSMWIFLNNRFKLRLFNWVSDPSLKHVRASIHVYLKPEILPN